jgi:nitrous oxidase accessory protein NosD
LGDPSPYSDIDIVNNHIHDMTWNGILVTDATVTGLNIERNLIDNCSFGIAFSNGSTLTDVSVMRNSLNDNDVGLGVLAVSASDMVVSHCSFKGKDWEHIDLGVDRLDYCTIQCRY